MTWYEVMILDRDKQITALRAAIHKHWSQKADDRCWMDDDLLYAAAGLPPVDRSVGDANAMLLNCKRFINQRCEERKWKTYAELEVDIEVLIAHLVTISDLLDGVYGGKNNINSEEIKAARDAIQTIRRGGQHH